MAKSRPLFAFLACACLPLVLGGCATQATRETPQQGEIAIRHAYQDRVMYGLGSPFRTAEMVLYDPRLSEEARRSLSLDLLQRTARGDCYRLDGTMLETYAPKRGEKLLAAIEEAFRRAPDERTAEAAARVAFLVYTGSEDNALLKEVAYAAAQLRDRSLAIRDARVLLDSAAALRRPATDLLPGWRRTRRFSVERPSPMLAEPVMATFEVLSLAQGILASFRARGAPQLWDGWRPLQREKPASALTVAEAMMLLGDTRVSVPNAVVGSQTETIALLKVTPDSDKTLIRKARDEEGLVAAARLVAASGDGGNVRAGRLLLSVGVLLHNWNAEKPIEPASRSAQMLKERWGISVRLREGAHQASLERFLTSAPDALYRMNSVFPLFRPQGLVIDIVRKQSRETLAAHEASGRKILLPEATGLSHLAHELGHDMDWQVSRRTQKSKNLYASEQGGKVSEAFRQTIEGLRGETLQLPDGARTTDWTYLRKPAEIFARGAEWYASTTLALSGQIDPLLASYQDEIISGLGMEEMPDVAGVRAMLVMHMLKSVTVLPDVYRDRFLERWGPTRALSATDHARIGLLHPRPTDECIALNRIERAKDGAGEEALAGALIECMASGTKPQAGKAVDEPAADTAFAETIRVMMRPALSARR